MKRWKTAREWWRRRVSRLRSIRRIRLRPIRREAVFFWATVVAGIGALLVIVTTAVGWVGDLLEDDPEGRIEVRRTLVGNGVKVYSPIGGTGQTPASTPRLDVHLRNAGGRTVLLEEAIVRIEDSVRLPSCVPPQGGGPVPKSEYEITLPLPPAGGVILRYPILDEVQAGRDSNLNLLFGFESPEPFSEYLYALHVELVTDASDRIDLGDFVLALPGAIDRRGFALPENNRWLTYLEDEYSYPQDRLVQTWCYRRNLDLVRRLIAHPGGRAEEVAALENVRPASGWPRFVDPRSPREAIDELLSTGLDDPSLAVFAASQTGDAELVTRTRERAVAVLLREVREWMGEGGSSLAVRVAREALTLEPSPDVKRLLLEAEAQFRAFEQEQEALTSGP